MRRSRRTAWAMTLGVTGLAMAMVAGATLPVPPPSAARSARAGELSSLAVASPEAATATAGRQGIAAAALPSLRSDVQSFVDHQAKGNPAGLWIGGARLYWRSNSGPALAAAAIAANGNHPRMLAAATRTFAKLIRAHVQPDGALGATFPGAQPLAIDTMFFADNLGMALWALRGRLSHATVSYWTRTLANAATYVINSGNFAWYANGNIVVGNALLMELAYLATGQAAFARDYQQGLDFAIHPGSVRWPGFGFILTRAAKPGSAGSGYFAESGGGKPGFDPDYTQVQLNELVHLYLVTRSAQVLTLVNMVFNQLWPLVDRTNWTMNTSGGTRRSKAGRYVGFDNSALALLSTTGRTGLQRYVASQEASMLAFYKSGTTFWNPTVAYYYGLEAATFLLLPDSTPARSRPA